jgi:hypothetical protein
MWTVVTNLSIWSSSSALSAMGTPGWSVRQSRTRPSLPPVTTLPSLSTATAVTSPSWVPISIGTPGWSVRHSRTRQSLPAVTTHPSESTATAVTPSETHQRGCRVRLARRRSYAPQPHAAARVASDEAPIGYFGHRGHLLVPVAVAKDELDWHAGLVGAPQPYPAILAAAEDPAVGERG